MKRASASAPAFGAELNGLEISSYLSQAKPTLGETYIVSTGSSTTSLLASTETAVALQLQAATSTVDPTSVGGLTGSSASRLQSDLNTFKNLWTRSETVAMAQQYGQVASTCPSSTTLAYVAISDDDLIDTSTPTSSLQRFSTTIAALELLVVVALPGDAYQSITADWAATMFLAFLAVGFAALIAALPYAAVSGFNIKQKATCDAEDITDAGVLSQHVCVCV